MFFYVKLYIFQRAYSRFLIMIPSTKSNTRESESINYYKSKLRTYSRNIVNENMDRPNPSKNEEPILPKNKLQNFKAPKRKHLTIEYTKEPSKIPPTKPITVTESNIKTEQWKNIKTKSEPVDSVDSDAKIEEVINNIKKEIKEETTEVEGENLYKVKSEPEEYSVSPNFAKDLKLNIKPEIKEECLYTNMDNFEPPFWKEVLCNMREMRKKHDAPVDTMGCDKCFDENASEKTIRYHVLIALMLSPQTKDQVTHSAMDKLKAHGLNVDNILKTSDETLGKLIYPVGFWKTKVKNIKKATEILKNEYDSDIPNTIKDLLKLPGVGPKIGHLCMNSAWKEVTGIGVDTHVHRISNRLAWVNPQTKTPEETRLALEKWLPKDLWNEVNHLMVGFGQTICRPIGPQCSNCLNIDICPFAKLNLGIKNKKLKKMK